MATYLVTGADRGIGEAICAQLNARGEDVIAACLGDGAAHRGRGLRIESSVDVRSDASVAAMAQRLGDRSIDVLIHNAGIVRYAELGSFRFEDFAEEYEVNALGPLRVTQALLPRLPRGAKIGVITSRVGSLSENESGGLYGYRMSKAAGNMAGLCLARELAPRGIAVVCLHPGTVRTEIVRGLPGSVMGQAAEPEEAALGLIARLDELTLQSTGEFRHANGQLLPW